MAFGERAPIIGDVFQNIVVHDACEGRIGERECGEILVLHGLATETYGLTGAIAAASVSAADDLVRFRQPLVKYGAVFEKPDRAATAKFLQGAFQQNPAALNQAAIALAGFAQVDAVGEMRIASYRNRCRFAARTANSVLARRAGLHPPVKGAQAVGHFIQKCQVLCVTRRALRENQTNLKSPLVK